MRYSKQLVITNKYRKGKRKMYQLRVTNWKDVELDLKEFKTEEEAKSYILAEWAGVDCLTYITQI